MVIAGVMSGSSLDGLDIAVVQFNENNDWELLWTFGTPYSEDWVHRIKNYNELSASEYISFTSAYSYYIGELLDKALANYPGHIDYISFHGHTLMHLPESGITEQIGNGGVIAASLNIPTITDFRIQDVVKGGVGTPLAPLVELHFFQGHDYYLNLGGIANITKIDHADQLMAYDICPCNQVLNYYSQLMGKDYDEDGNVARTGTLNIELIDYLNSIPYFELPAPKSLDNNWIIHEVIPNFPEGRVEDILHTFCLWMASCIANELDADRAPTSLMVSGGGAHNTFFMECLKKELAPKGCTLYLPAKEIIDFKEAILMALMAYNYLEDKPNVLSAVTGASSDSIGGALYKVRG